MRISVGILAFLATSCVSVREHRSPTGKVFMVFSMGLETIHPVLNAYATAVGTLDIAGQCDWKQKSFEKIGKLEVTNYSCQPKH